VIDDAYNILNYSVCKQSIMNQLTDNVDNLKVELFLYKEKFAPNDRRYIQLNDAIDRLSNIIENQYLYYGNENFISYENHISDDM
jgi:hypothetical protein